MRILRGHTAIPFAVFSFFLLFFFLPDSVSAQLTCASGQQYCPSGPFAGQCRPNQVKCPAESVSGIVAGCTACACPSGKVVCANACVEDVRGDVCVTSSGDAGTFVDACGTTCAALPPEYVVFTPKSTQARSSANPAIWVNQTGNGPLMALQGAGVNVLTANRTGIQLGGVGLDLGAATGGQNVLYGVARYSAMHANDALFLLQTASDTGAVTDRIRIDRNGNIITTGSVDADGNVHAQQLCIRDDCRSSWAEEIVSGGVSLQATTPGTAQQGNTNVTGRAIVGTLDVSRTIEAGSGNVEIVNKEGRIPALTSVTVADLSGAELTDLNADALASGTVPTDRLPNDLVRSAKATIFTAIPSGNGVLQGGLAVNPVAAGFGQALFGVAVNGVSRLRVDADGNATLRGSLTAGTENVTIINATGKIPGISSAYFASTSGSGLTNLNANTLASGTVPFPRLPSSLIVEGDSGATLTNLNASALANGTVPDERLPASVVRTTQRTVFAAAPSASGTSGASLGVNPASANAGFALFGVAVAGADRFTVQGNGDVTATGRVTVNPASAATGSALFSVQLAGAQRLVVDDDGDLDVASGITAGSANLRIVDGEGNLVIPDGGRLVVAENDSDSAYFTEVTTNNNDAVNLQLVLRGDANDSEQFSILASSVSPAVNRIAHAFTAGGNATHTGNLSVTKQASVGSLVSFGDVAVQGGKRLTVDGTLTVNGRGLLAQSTRVNQQCANASTCNANCNIGSLVLGGGCHSGTLRVGIRSSYPGIDAASWTCLTVNNETANLVAYAICAPRTDL